MKKTRKTRVGKFNLILGFLINLIIPGFGTIIIGKYEIGVIQLTLLLACFLIMLSNLSPVIAGAISFIVIGIWIWAFITNIQSIKENK